MHTFAMILDNPGEQPHRSRYRDPKRLAELGYTDLIVYPTTGLSGLFGPDTIEIADERQWVADQFDHIEGTLEEAKAAGLGTWLTYDAPTLARALVGHAMTCVNQSHILCPVPDELLEMSGQCLETLLSRFDRTEGIVLRLGDNDAQKIPYLIGNELYSPHCSRCANFGRADRLIKFIRFYHDLVVKQLGKKLIVRAWNIKPGGMHDDAELCQRVVSEIPEDDDLILSFKFTQTDFWRFQKWNPSSLVCGNRPIIYELQCQREFEAKGAVPNYQPNLWSRGMTEMADVESLQSAMQKTNVVGLWAWVRGGGWRGPYITEETECWVGANVVAVPRLANNPGIDPVELARHWIVDELEVDNSQAAEAILETLEASTQTVLESFYIGPYARLRENLPWYPSSNLIQDDQIDAEAAWTIIQRLPENMLDDVVAEKQAAEQRIAACRKRLNEMARYLPHPAAKFMPASLDYAESLTTTLHYLLSGMIAYRRYLRKRDPKQAQTAIADLQRCQNRWMNHSQRFTSPGAASTFSSDNLWDVTQRIIDDTQSTVST